jgi:hypothetical protein
VVRIPSRSARTARLFAGAEIGVFDFGIRDEQPGNIWVAG